MSKKEAFDAWKKLPPEDQISALASLPAFRSYCSANPDYRPIHACRFLKYRRFEGLAQAAQKTAAAVFVEYGTREWDAWKEHRGRSAPTTERVVNGRTVSGWFFESQWPPEKKETAA